MVEKAPMYEEHAEECRRRAETAPSPYLEATFGQLAMGWSTLAVGWKELAELRRRLEADRRN